MEKQAHASGALVTAIARLAAKRFALAPMILVACLLALVVMLCRLRMVDDWLRLQDVSVVLAATSVAIGIGSAFSCAVLGHLHDEPRGLWLGVSLTIYSLVAIPAATMSADAGLGGAPVGNVRMLAHAMVVVSGLAAVLVATRPLWDGWSAFVLGGPAIIAAGGLGVMYPELSLLVSTSQGVRFTICGLWLVAGISITIAARSARITWQLWAGLGYTVIAVAHIIRVAAGSPDDPLGITFSGLRFVGVALLFVGAAPPARRALVDAFQSRNAQLAELTDARADMDVRAQRDHDIRTSMHVLTTATALLNTGDRDHEEQALLRAAVSDEFARVNVLLQPHVASGPGRAPQDYDVLPLLQQRVALSSSTGMDIRIADAEPGLRARGNPQVLMQVLTNVLANCGRHAPGSPVRIAASRRGRMLVIRVRDFGPGVRAALEPGVFDCGVRAPDSPGQGFGLYVARRLLDAESGRVTLKSGPAERSGCTLIIEIPTAGSRRGSIAPQVSTMREAVVDEDGLSPEPLKVRPVKRPKQSAVRAWPAWGSIQRAASYRYGVRDGDRGRHAQATLL
jgi:two-component system OmpR family sensor kinase